MTSRQSAVALLMVALIGIFVVALTLQLMEASQRGYGLGINNRAHVSDRIAERAGLPAGVDADTLAEETNVLHGGGLWHDGWRLIVSVVLLLGTIFFWYTIISRLGSF